MAKILHLRARGNRHNVAIARLVVLLLVELSHVRAPAVDHGLVVLVIAGRQNDLLGVKLDILARRRLADYAGHLALCRDKLHSRGAHVGMEVVGHLLTFVGQNTAHVGAHISRLRADGRVDDGDDVLTKVKNVVAILIDACELGFTDGCLELSDIVAVGLIQTGTVHAPHDRLFGIVDVRLKKLLVSTPVAQLIGEVLPLFKAHRGALALDDRAAGAALRNGDGLLLENGDLCAQLGSNARSRNACSTRTDDDDVVVLFLVRDDLAQLTGRVLNLLEGQAGGNNGVSRADRSGIHRLALRLRNTGGGGLHRCVGGDSRTGNCINLGGLCRKNQGGKSLALVAADGRRFLAGIHRHSSDGVRIKGHLDPDLSDAARHGGVGAGGIDSLFLGDGRESQRGEAQRTNGSPLEEAAAADRFAHDD